LGNIKGSDWSILEHELEVFCDLIDKQKEQAMEILNRDVSNLQKQVASFEERWETLKPKDVNLESRSCVKDEMTKLGHLVQEFDDIKKELAELRDNFIKFDMKEPDLIIPNDLKSDIECNMNIWDIFTNFNTEFDVMCAKSWISLRTNIFTLDDFALGWIKKIQQSLSAYQNHFVTIHINDKLFKIRKAVPSLKHCNGESFKEDHWAELLQGKFALPSIVRLENLTCGHFLQSLDLLAEPSMIKYLKTLQSRAQGEISVRESLQELIAWSQTYEMKLCEHCFGSKSTVLIMEWNDIFRDLGDKQSLLVSLEDSPYIKSFVDTKNIYKAKMSQLDSCLHLLLNIQRKWIYLEPIMSRGSLPQEHQRFRQTTEMFCLFMEKIKMEPKLFNIVDLDAHPNLENQLNATLKNIEICQNALASFLEKKRSLIPRFYFVGDDDLLEIIGHAANTEMVQPYLKNLFQGIHAVVTKSDSAVVSIKSAAGEVVNLSEPVQLESDESWLEKLAIEQHQTLSALLRKCLESSHLDYEQYPSQILCLAEYIRFVSHVEDAIKNREGLVDLNEKLLLKLQSLTYSDLSGDPITQLKATALILDVIRQREVVDTLIKNRASELDSWVWLKQMKYYSEINDALPHICHCTIRMSSAEINYSYEYQGNQAKLVHTPLTDKCYLNLTQAMHFGFGGNLFGPAGTGKVRMQSQVADCQNVVQFL